jgi:hypothetical protein
MHMRTTLNIDDSLLRDAPFGHSTSRFGGQPRLWPFRRNARLRDNGRLKLPSAQLGSLDRQLN